MKVMLLVALLATGLIAGCIDGPALRRGDQYPSFIAKDIDNNTIRSADLAGKVVVIQWIRNERMLRPANESFSAVARAAEHFEGRSDVQFLSVSPPGQRDLLVTLREEAGSKWPMIEDTYPYENVLARKFGFLRHSEVVMVFDQDGGLVAEGEGYETWITSTVQEQI